MAKANNNDTRHLENIVQPEYKTFLNEIKQRIKSSQAKAALAVNSSLIHLYWNIGKLIAEKQTAHSWGTNVIDQLSLDLKTDFPGMSGFSARNLRDTKRFYLFYCNEIWRQLVAKLDYQPKQYVPTTTKREETAEDQSLIILQQLVAEIPWGHHLLILNKISVPVEAFFYIRQTIEHNWSRTMLTFHIEQDLFSRQGMGMSNFKETLPTSQAILAEQMLKDPVLVTKRVFTGSSR